MSHDSERPWIGVSPLQRSLCQRSFRLESNDGYGLSGSLGTSFRFRLIQLPTAAEPGLSGGGVRPEGRECGLCLGGECRLPSAPR